MNADEAVRLARLARNAGLPNWVKLEIHPDPRYLLPDGVETLKAAEQLVKEGFVVLPYINADPVLAKRLQDVGTATVMPLGSPIGSNRGLETRAQLAIIIEQAEVPVVVDAGLGAPSQAAEALEMGADAVLVNTAIAVAHDPVRMARAFRQAVEAGNLDRAARMLGRQFTILGTVVAGQQLGRQLGFPTANLAAHNEQFPPNGVYAVTARWQGATYPGVVNLGYRPTVAQPGGERLLELHLFDFDRQIYGDDVEVEFRAFLRPERKFANVDELRVQIARDADAARAI